MASALLSFSWADECSHSFKDFVKSPHLLADEVLMIDLQKPMVSLVFFVGPVPSPTVFRSCTILSFSLLIFRVLLSFRPTFTPINWLSSVLIPFAGELQGPNIIFLFLRLKNHLEQIAGENRLIDFHFLKFLSQHHFIILAHTAEAFSTRIFPIPSFHSKQSNNTSVCCFCKFSYLWVFLTRSPNQRAYCLYWAKKDGSWLVLVWGRK